MLVITSTDMVALEKQEFKLLGDHLAVEFMDRVGKALATKIDEFCKQNKQFYKQTVHLLAGKGNNAGDGYFCGKILLNMGYQLVAWEVADQKSYSPLCEQKRNDFLSNGGEIRSYDQQGQRFPPNSIIVDALFGTGFSGKLEGLYEALVADANKSLAPIFSIDIPSGLSGDSGFRKPSTRSERESACIRATRTYYLEFPKLGFFLENSWDYMGSLHLIPFGLSTKAHERAKPSAMLLDGKQIRSFLPKLERQRHKYQAGLVHVWAGSRGMEGAAALVCLAALRSGCGLVKLAIQDKDYGGFSSLNREVVRLIIEQESTKAKAEFLSKHFNQGSAIVIGPGLSTDIKVIETLGEVIETLDKPLVLDADALNAYARKPFPLPNITVMTPHMGELKRLLGLETFTMDQAGLEVCQNYAMKHKLTLVVKGAPTFIFHPEETVKIMTRGHPAIASAGTGDVLAGMIGAFLAQGLDGLKAACLATYIHGLSGELVARELGSYSLIAGDLISYLPKAFKELEALSEWADKGSS